MSDLNPITATADQIALELARLRLRLATMQQFNAQGDDNHAAIHGQIQVLEKPSEVSYDVIGSLLETLPFYVTDAMVRAREWIDGTYALPEGGTLQTALSDEWTPSREPDPSELWE